MSMMGTLRINGMSLPPANIPAAKAQTTNSGPLASVSVATQRAERTASADKGQNSSSAMANFASEITARLQASKKDDPKAAQTLGESLSATASEIKENFGQEKANEFMSRILTATDTGVAENNLVAATGGFFKDLASEAAAKPELLRKLGSIKDFLNRGLESEASAISDQDQSESSSAVKATGGLSTALNQYFGQKAQVVEDGQSLETKGFDSNFDRVTLQVARKTAEVGEGGDNWIVLKNPNNVKAAEVSVDESTWQMVANHLRTMVGNEKAAALFESDAGDFFGAVAASVATVAQENGQEAAYDFVKYLNENAASGLSSNGFSFQGWSLGRDYSQPEGPAAGAPLTPKGGGLWFGDPNMNQELKDKQHQGLLTNWKYTDPNSGASSIKVEEVDLNEIYAGQQAVSTTRSQALNKPAGNLVDAMI